MKEVENKTEKSNFNLVIKILFVFSSIAFAIPSIQYYIQNKTVLNFNKWYEFLLNDSDRLIQTIIYIVTLAVLTISFFLIIKNRKTMFKNTKNMFIFIAIVAAIFIAVIPFTCSDIFYYLGVGRIDGKYNQNPYYTTIKDFVEDGDNSKYLENDTVLQQGYVNDWSGSTVVYGSIWTLICRMVASLSFGNLDIGLLLFKLLNVLIHLLNCYIIYKITHKKIFVLLYGLNPYILLEAIAYVHNDIFMILCILVALYFLLRKKNLGLCIAFLAIATAIKYFAILLLPFVIIYYFRKEKPSVRFIKCLLYGAFFLLIFSIPYLFYIRDIHVLQGLFTQQEKFAKNFYIMILQYLKNPVGLANTVKQYAFMIFAAIYIITCIMLLMKKEIKFRKEIRKSNYFIMVFLFVLITNFQPWYIMWLFPLIMWQKSEIIKLTIYISLISQFANSIFLIYTEGWIYGTPFSFIFITSSLISYIVVLKKKELRKNKCFLKAYKEREVLKR